LERREKISSGWGNTLSGYGDAPGVKKGGDFVSFGGTRDRARTGVHSEVVGKKITRRLKR